MKHKKILALILIFEMLFVLTACQNDANNDALAENSTNMYSADDSDNSPSAEHQTSAASDENTETASLSINAETTTLASNSSDPALWKKSKIVEVYKQAAEKSTSVISEQAITLKDISVNNGDGAFNSMLQLIKPIITQVIKNNATESEGITGGHQKLAESDVYEARAYASGNNTVIEMIMNEQIDGAHGDRLSGTVGHAISVVGDIGFVTDQLADSGLPVDIPDENISMTYSNPVLKVLIDGNGTIVNGTWSYIVDLEFANFNVGSAPVDNTSVVLENVITVNGGFSE